MLELAVLGLLHESPMHGYELRKRLYGMLGTFGAYSCGTLYPTLRRMLRAGLLAEDSDDSENSGGKGRARRVYRLTTDGQRRFADLVGECGSQVCADESFVVRVAFFARTPVECRMRILQARKRRVEERGKGLREVLAEQRFDRYTLDLHRLGLDNSERELRWLNELIERERAEQEHDG